MFPKQIEILSLLPQISTLLDKHQYPHSWLDALEISGRNFVVRVPLVGAFSTGKSSLLNALIGGEPLFHTNIDPETAVPAELSYAPQERFTGCLPDGKRFPLRREEIRSNQLQSLFPGGWVDAQVPSAALAGLSHLRLVDMPGWGSGNDKHAQAIDGYVSRSLAYCVVVSAEAGCLNESIRNALIELKVHDMPIIAIVSKCDKKPADEIAQVVSKISAEMQTVLGKPPLRVVKVSERKKDIAEFQSALALLEQDAEPLFNRHVVQPVAAELRLFSQYLATLVNRDDLNSEQIALERERIAAEMEEFDRRLRDETRQLDDRLPKIIAAISQHLQASLTGQLDTLSNLAVNGRDLRGTIEQTTRLAVAQGIQGEFEPEIQRYFEKVGSLLPQDYALDLNLPDNATHTDDDTGGKVIRSAVFIALGQLMKKHPIGEILLPFLPLIEELFSGKGKREVAEAERHESVRQQVLTQIIPEVMRSTERSLQTLLSEHVQGAKDGITAALQKKRDVLESARVKLTEELALGKESFEAARQLHQADLQTVQAMLTRLEAA